MSIYTRKLLALPIIVSGMFYHAAVSAAPINMTVDAFAHCVENGSVTGTPAVNGIANTSLPPGRYVASISSSNMSCNAGALSGGCAIDTVMIQAQSTTFSAKNKANWGMEIKKGSPVVLDIPGTNNYNISAFVVDSVCSDNTGTGTLRFQKVN